MIRIAVDAMGGDHAPSAVIDGAVAAARHLAVRIALVGQRAVLEQALTPHPDWPSLGLELVKAPDVIGISVALRRIS
jgi:glycerol-3-phosphate acyltransferase PlsX